MKKPINFTCNQVSDFSQILERSNIECDFLSDSEASTVFSDLLIEMCRSLDSDQAQDLWDKI